MAGKFIYTLADVAQIPGLFSGNYFRGFIQTRMAIVGRSNVGKSTLINALIGTRLAQVSKQPGKTRAIHFYFWDEIGKIVADLPGYGYAKASGADRDRWAEFISAYFESDPGLERAVVLLDARHGPTANDLEAIKFLMSGLIPITFVFTKSDSLKTQSERSSRKKEAAVALNKLGYDPKNAFWVSSQTKEGIKPLILELAKGAR